MLNRPQEFFRTAPHDKWSLLQTFTVPKSEFAHSNFDLHNYKKEPHESKKGTELQKYKS